MKLMPWPYIKAFDQSLKDLNITLARYDGEGKIHVRNLKSEIWNVIGANIRQKKLKDKADKAWLKKVAEVKEDNAIAVEAWKSQHPDYTE